MDYTVRYASPLGEITMASDGASLTGLWFAGQKYFAAGLTTTKGNNDLPVFALARRWLDVYFDGRQPDFTPPLLPRGTAFQQAVWALLLTIPYGQTTTYGAIAAALAKEKGIPRMSARAVGGAVGRNPISILIPCHRVVGADGSLTGYAGGTERKQALLVLEQRH